MLYDGVREVAERLDVGTALLHLGGVQFPVTGPIRYTMTADDAVELCGLIRPHTAIPIHYEGWKHFRQGRDAIERALRRGARRTSARVSAGCRSAWPRRSRSDLVTGTRQFGTRSTFQPLMQWTFPAEAPTPSKARAVARAFAAESGADADTLAAVALCVSEAVSNVVVHAYRDRESAR